MALSPEIEAQILRYYHAECWRIGTIATELQVHRDSVARVRAQAGLPALEPVRRPSAIDPYLPFILETLTQFPRLRASRVYDMVKSRGYPGRPDHFRHLIARHRPRPKAEAYLRLRTLPGEQMQIDWGHFGLLDIGRARRPLMGFGAVLSWSRQIFLRFYLGAHMENFLRGHVGALSAWGSCPRVALYGNLKSAVLERQGSGIRFHPTLLALAGHYRFDPRPVAVARGNENAKQESFWGRVGGRLMAMLEGEASLTLDVLNQATQAWVEQEYHRHCHSELEVTPLQRYLAGPNVRRDCPASTTLSAAFQFEVSRRQRRSDGTLSLEGTRFEIPARYRHLERVHLRYARWDLTQVDLVDPRIGTILCPLKPLDKSANADSQRRRLIPPAADRSFLPPTGMAPLLGQLLADYAATGLPPAYLPTIDKDLA
jgi:transposase